MKQTVLSGVQPSGDLHLGNYIGALSQWARLLDDYESYFCVVDLHALTDPYAVRELELHERVKDVAAMYVASGIDPERCAIFAQSMVPEHVQLMWILMCVTPLGSLERMTQFKAKAASRGRLDAGLLAYPVLQAADILAYDTDIVPVGDDQKQHIELCRDVAMRFNSLFGDTFKTPEAKIPTAGARVMGLDDPTEKMSKSIASVRPNHSIGLLDGADLVKRKIAKAVTDSNPVVSPEEMGPGTQNLVEILAALTESAPGDVAHTRAGKTYKELKGEVTEVVVETLTPVQKRYAELRPDDAVLTTLLARGAERARRKAQPTLRHAEVALGLRSQSHREVVALG